MSKMSKVVRTVAVVAIVIGRGVGYFTGSRMAASNQSVESSGPVSETTDSTSDSSAVSETTAADSTAADPTTAVTDSTDSTADSASVDSTDSAAASDSSTSETAASTPEEDSHLIGHRVFQTDESAEHPEYIVIFYDTGSKKLVQLADETIFYKSAGYTSESVENFDVSEVYPGTENMDFMTKEVTEETEYIRLGIYFNNLEKNENLKALHNAGIIVLDDSFGENNYVNAESLCQSMLSNGKPELDITKMPSNLNYTVNQ